MKTREEHLAFCKICRKRKFLMEKGLVCSLTDEWADFEEECGDFELDTVAENSQKLVDAQRKEETLSHETGGLHVIGIKNGSVAGALALLFGCGTLYFGYFIGFVMGMSFFFIVGGLVLIMNHQIKLAGSRKMKKIEALKKADDVIA